MHHGVTKSVPALVDVPKQPESDGERVKKRPRQMPSVHGGRDEAIFEHGIQEKHTSDRTAIIMKSHSVFPFEDSVYKKDILATTTADNVVSLVETDEDDDFENPPGNDRAQNGEMSKKILSESEARAICHI